MRLLLAFVFSLLLLSSGFCIVIQKLEPVPYSYTDPPRANITSYRIILPSGKLYEPEIGIKVPQITVLKSAPKYRYLLFQPVADFSKAGWLWLKAANISVVDMIPNNTLVLKIPNSKLNSLISQPFTRWLGVLPPEFKMDSILLNLLYTEPNQIINVSITLFDYNDNATLEHIKKFNKTPLIMYGTYYFALNVSDARELATPENIRELYRDMRNEGPATLLAESTKVAGANNPWEYFYDTHNIAIAVIDSGIQSTPHPHFNGINLIYSHDFVDGDQLPFSYGSCPTPTEAVRCHGTHVAGIISGSSMYEGRNLTGISNKARLVIVRNINEYDAIMAYPTNDQLWQSALDPEGNGNYNENTTARIISGSWGISGSNNKYTNDSLETDKVINGKIAGQRPVIVFAAGNEHRNLFLQGVREPGAAKNVITVGAVADYYSSDGVCSHIEKYVYNESADYVMDYSSRGTSDGRMKPDILAPGSDITSSILENKYESWDGTSMATPHVSAVAYQLLTVNPWMPSDAVKAVLITSAVGGSTTWNKDINKAWGTLNRIAALAASADIGTNYWVGVGEVGNSLSGKSTDVYFPIDVPSGVEKLVFTLAYNDEAGQGQYGPLKNDLHVYFESPGGTNYLINDNINNVEKFTYTSNIYSGQWKFHVQVLNLTDSGGTIPKTQNFSLAIIGYKRTQYPELSLTASASNAWVNNIESFEVWGTLSSKGFQSYHNRANVSVIAGSASLSSGKIDGTDADKDVPGMIAADQSRQTRKWKFTANQPDGDLIFEIKDMGKFIHDDSPRLASAQITVHVDSSPPSPVSGLTSPSQTANSISLSWNSASDSQSGIKNYIIFKDGINIANTTSLTYADTGLAEYSQHTYQIAAVDYANNIGGRSALLAMRTLDVTAPGAVTGLANNTGNTWVYLTWNPSTDNAAGIAKYLIYRNGTNTANATGTGYNITGLKEWASYSFTAGVVDNVGNYGQNSSAIITKTGDATAPAQVSLNYRLTDVYVLWARRDMGDGIYKNYIFERGNLTLTWSAASDSGAGVSHYRIWKNGINFKNTTALKYEATIYEEAIYGVSAVDKAGNEGQKNSINIFAQPGTSDSCTPDLQIPAGMINCPVQPVPPLQAAPIISSTLTKIKQAQPVKPQLVKIPLAKPTLQPIKTTTPK